MWLCLSAARQAAPTSLSNRSSISSQKVAQLRREPQPKYRLRLRSSRLSRNFTLAPRQVSLLSERVSPSASHSTGRIVNAANIASFDLEEHHRIEAAVGLSCSAELKADYAARMESATRRLLDQLAAANVAATFFVVGEIARTHPKLVSDICAAGHEVGSHSWDHKRVHRFTPESFREDLRTSKD